MMILRGVNLRYEGDTEIQSATFTAGISEKDEILKNLKKSPKFKEAWKEGEIRNCRFSHAKDLNADSEKLRSSDVISLGINFIESKIYFYTQLNEIETISWILNILSNVNLDKKT